MHYVLKVFIDRMVALPFRSARCICYGGGKLKGVDAFYFVRVTVEKLRMLRVPLDQVIVCRLEVLPDGYPYPPSWGKEYPGTREYLRSFWAGTRVSV